jgi:hypothetical protein
MHHGSGMDTLTVDTKKFVSSSVPCPLRILNLPTCGVTIVTKQSNHNTADCRAIAKLKGRIRFILKPKMHLKRSL